MITPCAMRVWTPSFGFSVGDDGVIGDVAALVTVLVDVGVGVGGVGGVGGVPITPFSQITHPSPITTGPSNEYTLARGWNTVPAPMAIENVPWKAAVSAIVAVGWAVIGARGVDGEDEVEARCWCACCDGWWAGGGLRYWRDCGCG